MEMVQGADGRWYLSTDAPILTHVGAWLAGYAKPPLWSARSLGALEADRDRRKHGPPR